MRSLALTLAVFLVLDPGSAAAQAPVVFSQATGLDPSIQTAAMGGASAAVFWLDEPNEWGNPATLGSVRGVRYVHEETDFGSVSLDTGELRSDRILVGAFGIGASFASFAVQPREEVRSFSVGVSALDLLSHFGSIGWRDRISLHAGHTWKDLEVQTGVDPDPIQPRRVEGSSADWGALVRVVPFDGIGSSVLDPRDQTAVRLELAGGYTEQNYREPTDEDAVRPLEREITRGASGRLTAALPTRIGRGWFWDFATPTLSFAFAYERSSGETLDGGGARYDLVRSGGEITILDMVALRHGRVDDETGFEGNTWGAGVTLQYRKAIGVKLDWARVPWGADSSELDRYAITAFIEPLRFDTSGGLR